MSTSFLRRNARVVSSHLEIIPVAHHFIAEVFYGKCWCRSQQIANDPAVAVWQLACEDDVKVRRSECHGPTEPGSGSIDALGKHRLYTTIGIEI
jgi:hypothetical protein